MATLRGSVCVLSFIKRIKELKNKRDSLGAGERAQLSRALAALRKDLDLITASTLGHSQAPVTPAPGNPVPSSGLCGHVYANTCACMGMFTQFIKKKKSGSSLQPTKAQ